MIITLALALVLLTAHSLLLASEEAQSDALFLSQTYEGDDRPCLILLHGLGARDWLMDGVAWNLEEDYWVVNQAYPSTSAPLEYLAPKYITKAIDACASHAEQGIDMVTHSMGGIMLRQYLSVAEMPQLRLLVMIAPPNRGSEVVDNIGHWRVFQRMMGPAGTQLGTNGGLSSLPSPSVPFAVIAGDLSFEPWFDAMFDGPNDGRVSVDSTKLDGMSDFIVIHQHHSLLLWDPRTWQQVRLFLQQEAFDHQLLEDNDASSADDRSG